MENAPCRAQEHHENSLPVVVKEALAKSNVTSISDLEAIAVTIGPG